ncbi:MAG: tetratricopeptide repeat protein [Candidatus Riflebacteria bacterium]|nr:tetratricopeptide repeat protein [Candidatus Riflebacteria bacterium]
MQRWGLAVLACLLLAVPGFALTLDTLPDYRDAGMRLLVRGTQKLQGGDFVGATEDLRQAVRLRPDMPEAFHNLGFAFEKMGDTRMAVKAYEKALALNPNYPSALNNLGFLLATLELDAQRAVLLCQRAVELEPATANFRDSLGWACYKAGRQDEAISHFRAAIKADPTFFKSYFNLGFVEFTRKNYAEAARNLTAVLRLNRDYLKAYIPLAVSYEKTNQSGKALYVYQQALTKAPAGSPIRRHIERELHRLTANSKSFYFSKVKQIQASSRLTDYLKSKGKLGSGAGSGSTIETSGTFTPVAGLPETAMSFDAALPDMAPAATPAFGGAPAPRASIPSAASRPSPGRPAPSGYAPGRELSVEEERRLEKQYSLAKSYLDRGLVSEAAAELEKVLAAAGEATVGRQARQLLLKVRRELEDRNKDAARTHLDMGKDFFRSGKYDMAEEQFRKALSLSPENAVAFKDLALLHYNQGKFKEAYEECKKALALDQTLKEAYVVLGSLYTKKGRIDEALRTLRRIREVSDTRDAVDELAERMIASLNAGG